MVDHRQPSMLGIEPADGLRQPGARLGVEQRPGDVEVAAVLRPVEPRLEEQHDLRVEVADAVVGHPGALRDRGHVAREPLVGPPAVAVGSQRQVDDPRRGGVLTDPDLALGVLGFGELVVQRAQRAAVVAPQVPGGFEMRPQGRDVAAEDRQVDVLVLAFAPRERLDGPAADQPPGPVEAGQQLSYAGRVEGLPRAVQAEECLVLGALLRGEVERLAGHRNATSASTPRWSVPSTATVAIERAVSLEPTSTWSI